MVVFEGVVDGTGSEDLREEVAVPMTVVGRGIEEGPLGVGALKMRLSVVMGVA